MRQALVMVLEQLNQVPLYRIDIGLVDDTWIRLDHALQTDWLPQLGRRFAADFPGLDRRGEGAFIVARLSHLFTSLLAGCDLVSGVVPRLSTDTIWVRLTPDQLQLRLSEPEFIDADIDSIRRLIIDLMTPFIEPVTQFSRLSKTPQWRLVADAVASSWLLAGQNLVKEDIAKKRALMMIHEAPSELSNKFTGFMNVEVYIPGADGTLTHHHQSYRSRSGCCRVYTADNHDYCATCIHLKPEQRHQRLQIALRNEQVATA